MIGEFGPMLMGALLTGLGATLGGIIIKKASNRIKWESPDMEYLKSAFARMEKREAESQQEVAAMCRLQEVQMEAMLAMLMAMKKGDTNGDLEKAIANLKSAHKEWHNFILNRGRG